MTPAPGPIRRSSFDFLQAGHFFSGSADMLWNSSKRWPQALQA
jgi:hypothetical protein